MRPTVAASYAQQFLALSTINVANVTVGAGQSIVVFVPRTARTVSSVTWDIAGVAQALTQRGNASTRNDLWYHLTPTAGVNKTVRVVLSGSGSGAVYIFVLNNVDAADPFGGQALHMFNTASTNISRSVASVDATNFLVLDALSVAANEATAPNASQTEVGTGFNSASSAAHSVGASSKDSTGATTTMAWAWTTSAAPGYLAQAYKGAAGGSPATVEADFTSVPTTSFAAGVTPGARTLAAGFTSVDVAAFAGGLTPGARTLAAGFVSVQVVDFDAAIAEGEQLVADFSETSIGAFAAALTPGARTLAAGFLSVPIGAFDAAITQATVLLAGFAEVPISTWAAGIARQVPDVPPGLMLSWGATKTTLTLGSTRVTAVFVSSRTTLEV